jgi:molybdate transport system substrate-binding protein
MAVILSRRRVVAGLAAGALALPPGAARAAAPGPRVAAAANIQAALERIAAAFGRETGLAPRIAYGASGALAGQIAQGAPFDLFLSADEALALDLARRGFARDAGAVYAIGRLALVAGVTAPVAIDPALAGLGAALADGRVTRLAIANPELAPYGVAALAALARAGLLDGARRRFVTGAHVAQVAQFVLTGAAEAGFVPLSLARAPETAGRLKHATIAEDWHAPLRQRMVLTTRAGAAAARFYAYLSGPAARAVFEELGYSVPPTPGGG